MVGEGRFELPASCSQSRRAAKLRHSPETASVAVVVTVSGPTLPRMPTEPVPPELLEPVSVRSRLVRAPGVRYTEVAGAAVVWEPTRRALHELSPAAAALWAALDGRPFGDVIAEAECSLRRTDDDRARSDRGGASTAGPAPGERPRPRSVAGH